MEKFCPTLIFILSLLPFICGGAQLNKPCHMNSDCEVENSHCRIPVAACSSGTCHCDMGFQDVGGSCKRQIMLGFICNNFTDVCRTNNAECLNKKCNCSKGHRRGLKGDCILDLQTERFNDTCFDSIQCYYNLKCFQGRCQCEQGFKLLEDYDCIKREIGDYCQVDADCSQMANAVCTGNQCSCAIGLKRMHYLTDEGVEALICAPAFQPFREEGEACNVSSQSNYPTVCKSPLVCVECSNTKAICTRPMMLLSGTWTIEWLFKFVDYVISRLLLLLGF